MLAFFVVTIEFVGNVVCRYVECNTLRASIVDRAEDLRWGHCRAKGRSDTSALPAYNFRVDRDFQRG